MNETSKSIALTFARVVLGGTALLYGIASTFDAFGGTRFDQTVANLAASMPLPSGWLYTAISLALLVCGLALVIGLAVRTAALVLLGLLVWHAVADGRYRAFFLAHDGCERVLALGALCIVLAVHGPGAWKLNSAKRKQP